MSFKVGDGVVCVKKDDWVYTKTKKKSREPDPYYKQELIVDEVLKIDLGVFLRFEQYAPSVYSIRHFRKIDEDSTSNFKSNSISKQLAREAEESKQGEAFEPMKTPKHLEV